MGQTDYAARLLAERHLGELAVALLPGHRVEVLAIEHPELKLVERLADQVVRARLDGEETILHFELQLRHESDLPARVLAYHALLRHRSFPLPVRSMVVYLMHAPPPGELARGLHEGQVSFEYETFCPWERPIGLEQVRRQPVLAPLAVLTPAIREAELPGVRRVLEEAGLPAERREDLRVLTYFLGGRRFPLDLLRLMIGSKAMEDSVTYQYVIEKGREEGRLEGREEGRLQGREEGRLQGREEGQALGLRRAILDLVAARLERATEGLEERLSGLDADELHALFSQLLRAADEGQLRALLAAE